MEEKKSKKGKYIALGLLTFILLIVFWPKGGDKEEPEPTPASEVQLEGLTGEEKIVAIVGNELAGKNNLEKDFLREVKAIPQQDGGYVVLLHFNSDDNLSKSMRIRTLERKMSEIYTALFTSGEDIKSVTIYGFFPMVDEYGNENDMSIYETELTSEEAEKINWDADGSTLRLEIIPGVWTVLYIHPEFQE